MKPRRYTGTKDGIARGPRKGLLEFIKQAEAWTGGALWNNGHFVVRPIRGASIGGQLSVHATGRAVDLSYRQTAGKGKPNGRKKAEEFMDLLVANNKDLGIECILDYFPTPHGRGWRCDRMAWQDYKSSTIHGAPGGDWIHVELSPRVADTPLHVVAVFDRLKAT